MTPLLKFIFDVLLFPHHFPIDNDFAFLVRASCDVTEQCVYMVYINYSTNCHKQVLARRLHCAVYVCYVITSTAAGTGGCHKDM